MSENKDQFDVADLAANLPAAAAALSLEDREGLVNALKNKLQNLAGQHSDVLETLTPNVRKRVEALKGLQSQHDDLVAKFHEERAALEAKYQKLYEPLYEKRYEIVNGVVEVGEPGEAVMEQPQENAPEAEKGVPDFWLTAMKTNEVLAEEITERDEGALKYLKDLRWSRIDKSQSFKLEFFFDSNPYFKNAVLTKIYHMVDDDDPILEKAIGTGIEWYQGKCLTQKILKKKPRKGSKNAKPITKTETCDSFFNFFNPPEVPDDDDDDVAEDLQNLMEHDYEIGSTVKEKIIPRAVSWFTGEAVQGDEFGDRDDEGDDDEHEDGEDEDEDDDDDNDDMEEVELKNVKKGSAGAKKSGRVQPGHGQAGERPPECKQQ